MGVSRGASATPFADTFDTDPTGGIPVTSFSSTLGSVSFTFTFTGQGNGGDMAWENQFGDGDSASINLASSSLDTGAIERVTIVRTDSNDFTFNSIFINNTAGQTITVGGYNNNVLVGSTQSVANGSAATLDFGGIAVDEVRLSGSDFFNTNMDTFTGDTTVSNSPPTNVSLSSTSIAQSSTGSGATVGTLSTTDADGGDTHTYALVANGASGSGSCGASGDADNASFQTSTNQLQTAGSLSAGTYNVCVQSDDGTDTFQKTFTVTVVDDVPAVFENGTPTVGGVTFSGATVSADLDEEGTVYYVVVSDGAGAPSSVQVKFGQDSGGGAALASGNFSTSGTIGSDSLSGLSPGTAYDLYVVAEDDEATPNLQAAATLVNFTTQALDSDGNVTASSGVTEPVPIPTTASTSGVAVNIFDFTISDGGGSDGQALSVSQIKVHTGGTVDPTKLTYRLNGPDASNVTGSYSSGVVTFSGLSISVADGGSETYTVNGYYNDNTGLAENQTLILSTDGDTDFTVGSGGTRMGAASAVTNGSGSTVAVTATKLVFTTEPAGSVSGNALTTQPVVMAKDAAGNTDVDFTGNVTLTEASSGTLSGTTTLAASGGVATFTNVAYTATADQESFTLTAFASGLGNATSSIVTSDVVATRLIFATQPAPTSVQSGQFTSFTTAPVVNAVDANSTVDTGYSTDFVLSVTDPNDGVLDGTVNSLSGTGDADASATTVTLTPSSGSATFSGLAIQYTNGGATDTIALRGSSGGLASVNSSAITSSSLPTVTDGNISISGATGTGGAFRIGDTVTATWDNTASGDNNSGITGVTVDLGQFGGGAALAASNSSGIWTATYTITAGTIDAINRNVSVSATSGGGTATTADTSNATVDNQAPAVTDASISISGASGAGNALKAGDTLTVSWDNTAAGDNNPDIDAATVDFSAFGGGSTVAAVNASGIWTATLAVTTSAPNGSGLNVSLTPTDDAGNSTTTSDSSDAVVDTVPPGVQFVGLPADGTYGAGEHLDFQVNYDETVTVNGGGAPLAAKLAVAGMPRLHLTVGSDTRYANYRSGSGSDTLVFRYTVQSGDLDRDGIDLANGLDLNGGSITDPAGNPADTDLAPVGNTSGILIAALALPIPAQGPLLTLLLLATILGTAWRSLRDRGARA